MEATFNMEIMWQVILNTHSRSVIIDTTLINLSISTILIRKAQLKTFQNKLINDHNQGILYQLKVVLINNALNLQAISKNKTILLIKTWLHRVVNSRIRGTLEVILLTTWQRWEMQPEDKKILRKRMDQVGIKINLIKPSIKTIQKCSLIDKTKIINQGLQIRL